MMKRTLRIALSMALAAILLVLFLYNVDLGEVARSLKDARPAWIAASTALALLAYWMRAGRWQLILRSAGPTRHSSALIATAVGYAAMAALPARAGDIVRPIVLARRDPIPLSAALASMITERLFDLFTVVLFYLFFVLWPPPELHAAGPEAQRVLELLNLSGWIAAAGLLTMVAVLFALFHFHEAFVDVVCRMVGRLRDRWRAGTRRFLEHFLDGLRVVQRGRDLAATVAASILLWLVIYAQVHTVLFAFDLHFPFRVSFLLVALAVAGLAVPTPGGIGGFHKATQLGLVVVLGVELPIATGVAIAYHAVSFLPITLVGLACLPLLGMSARDVGSLHELPEESRP